MQYLHGKIETKEKIIGTEAHEKLLEDSAMEYHKTKDPYHVKQILGRRRMAPTMLYINIEETIFYNAPPDKFHVKVAKTAEEIKELFEVGFEYVLQKDGLAYFKKRK